MKKQILLTTLCVLTLASMSAFADVTTTKSNAIPNKKPPQFEHRHHQGPSPEFQKNHKKHIEEFEQRLNLTAEQKAQIEKNREKSKARLLMRGRGLRGSQSGAELSEDPHRRGLRRLGRQRRSRDAPAGARRG